MKIFIGGSIGIKQIDDTVKSKLDNYMRWGATFLIGDAYGADNAVQKYCAACGYENVIIYASNGRARNNIGGWKVSAIAVPSGIIGKKFYMQKDIAMTADCDFGFMIWNGKSKGTLANIRRLTECGKTCKVYLTKLR